jgi:hypothetical protein
MKGCIYILILVAIGVGASLLPGATGEAQVNRFRKALFSETQTFNTEVAALIGGWAGLRGSQPRRRLPHHGLYQPQ